jgi:hypothetical protein
MDTNRLKSFAQRTRTELMGQVARRLETALGPDSAERREAPAAMRALEGRITLIGRAMVIEQVAYIWFNRFTALRYMDVNGYLTPMVVSPAPDRTRPELLEQAAAGALPDHLSAPVATRVRDLLEGRVPSREPQVEAYRLLLVASCNHLGGVMPFLFEEIADYTEILMPNELLAADGWVAQMRDVMTEAACQDVEIIGWLYQFYISEKKDQVFAGLKKNVKITAENIPAATQLFTPHWIVRYLVENSLGRLWLLNRPASSLASKMDYYIAPVEAETDFLRITRVEDIRICDPACGSGHMLTYAFDLLYAIYEEEGYEADTIPALILTHNLTGVEIDDRAGALAAFALAMKAAARLGRRRFLRMGVTPDICVLQNVSFTDAEMQDVAAVVGTDLFTGELRETLGQFEQAKNFGSLIVPKLRDPAEALRVVEARDFAGDLLLRDVQERVVAVLRMAEALSPKYHVVVANPPYMGGSGMNGKLQEFAKRRFPDSKSDLFAMFIERGFEFVPPLGLCAMVTMQSWMFLSSYEKLRVKLTDNSSIVSMIHMGNMVMGIAFGTAGTVWKARGKSSEFGAFCFVDRGDIDALGIPISFPPQNERNLAASGKDLIHRVSGSDFAKIPSTPIAYWVTDATLDAFSSFQLLNENGKAVLGMNSTDNHRFVREFHEVSLTKVSFDAKDEPSSAQTGKKWFPYTKGGAFRKYYGNRENVINWEVNGREIHVANGLSMEHRGAPVRAKQYQFKAGITWTFVTSGGFGARYSPEGAMFDVAGSSYFPKHPAKVFDVLGFMCGKIASSFLSTMNPTLNFQVGNIGNLPFKDNLPAEVTETTRSLVATSKSDWDAYETSWDFTTLPLLHPDHRAETLEHTYTALRTHWQGMTDDMQRLEEENNRIFIDAYGLADELTPEVPLNEITLTCNPAYRYGGKTSDADRETRLRADTVAEFLSYAVGCMFGRYSLDAPGLILANQGETLADYLARVPNPQFMPDKDNVIPLFEEDWFEDDAYQRFREFLALTFGPDRLVENLEFMRQSLGKEVRTYLAKDFYADHVQRYKKRPIYWLVSSPKGAFQALIYMHRYTPDTLNITLNDYVRALRDKLEAGLRTAMALEINQDASAAEKNRAKRDIDRFAKQIAEVTEWERDILYPLAVERIPIDLDDGVKRNYPRFPGVLKPIKGLETDDA